MNKTIKILIIVVSVLAIAVISVSIFIKSYLTDERVKSFVTEAAQKSLNRKVSLGEIKISLFKGIVVKDFEVKEKEKEVSFINADEFVLKYQLFPLLSKKLIIDELSIVGPQITIKKNIDGSYNFSDIGRTTDSGEATEQKDELRSLPVTMNVNSISVRNARLKYIDTSGKIRKALISLDAEMAITGKSAKDLSSEGEVELEILEALLKDEKEPFRNIKINAEYDFGFDLASKNIIINSLDADVIDIPLNIQGSVGYADETSLALDIKAPAVKLSKIVDYSSGYLPEGMNPDGEISLKLWLDKKPLKDSRISFNGEIKINNVSLTFKGIRPSLNGSIKITSDKIAFHRLKLHAGDSRADITGSILDYLEYPDVKLDVKSSLLNFDQIVVDSQGSKKIKTGESEKSTGDAEEIGPVKMKLRAKGSVIVDKFMYGDILINNLKSQYELKDNIFKITSLSGDTLKGDFKLKSSLDLNKKGTLYNMEADVKGIKLEDLVNTFAPKAKDKLYGTLFAKAQFSGAGTVKENIKRNLRGKGSFSIKEGTIKNAEVVNVFLVFLGLQDLREIDIQKGEGSFTVSQGVVHLTSVISNEDLIIDEKGTIGLDESLDIGINLKMAERHALKLGSSSISKFLSEEEGWSSIPLRLEGTLSKPSYKVDTKALGKKATDKIKEKLEEKLYKLIPGEKKKTEGTQQEKSISPEDLIKGIFGK